MEFTMDRRQRKTRTAIFHAFTDLLACMPYEKITVGRIIEKADVGRATFYAHFETKEDLLKAFCAELFDHIIESAAGEDTAHSHIFDCDAPDSVFLHLLQHLQKNDNQILDLLSGGNDRLFSAYFKAALIELVKKKQALFAYRKDPKLPEAFWIDHIASVFVDTVRWWLEEGRRLPAETVAEFFMLSV